MAAPNVKRAAPACTERDPRNERLPDRLNNSNSSFGAPQQRPCEPLASLGAALAPREVSALTLATLAHHQIWVAWKQEMRAGRPTKVPYDPRTGRCAASDDAGTWATRDEAQWWAATEHANGIGVMFCPVDGCAFLCGIDLDSCRDPDTGNVAPWAQAVIHRFATYTEVSPSGTGVKLFFTVANADLRLRPSKGSLKASMDASSNEPAATIRRQSKSTAGGGISPSPKS